jgi:hypothetical protein
MYKELDRAKDKALVTYFKMNVLIPDSSILIIHNYRDIKNIKPKYGVTSSTQDVIATSQLLSWHSLEMTVKKTQGTTMVN